MNLRRRYRQLTFWNRIGFWGSLASLLSLPIAILAMFPRRETIVGQSSPPPVQGATPTPQAPIPLITDVMLLVDTSASMSGTPLSGAVADAVARSAPTARVGLATFDQRYRLVLPPGRYPTNEYTFRLRNQPSDTCNHFCEAVSSAAGSMRGAKHSRLLIFTDGQFYPCSDSVNMASCEFEVGFPEIEIGVVLMGKANATEIERLLPNAVIDRSLVGIGGRPGTAIR